MAVKRFNTRIQLKNDTGSNWSSASSLVLLKGEFAWNSDINNFKIGDGTSEFSALRYVLPAFGNTLIATAVNGVSTYQVNIDNSTITSNNGVLSAVPQGTAASLTIGSMEFDGTTAKTVTTGTGLEFDPSSAATNTIAIKHSNSTVTAGTYGSTTQIPSFTVDAQGHITAASNNNITVGDAELSLTGDTWLVVGTGTGFTANSTTDAAYTVTHKAATDTGTTSSEVIGATTAPTEEQSASNTGKIAKFDTVTYSFDTAGHVTGHNVKTNTIVFPSAADLGLSSAMHFIGTSTSDPKGESGATVSGHTTWEKGDVVLYGNKEYVLSGDSNIAANWTELGDEGSHALKTVTITGTGALGGGGTLEHNREITHNTSGVTAGTYATNAATTLTNGGTFNIPQVTVDTYGHITAASDVTLTLPTITANDATLSISDGTNTDQIFSADASTNATVTFTGSTGITTTVSDNAVTIGHSNSITAGTASGSATGTVSYGGTIDIPTVTYDGQGHITRTDTTTVTLPAAQIASEVSYTNTDSGLTTSNVQDAIDELDGRIDTIETGTVTNVTVNGTSIVSNRTAAITTSNTEDIAFTTDTTTGALSASLVEYDSFIFDCGTATTNTAETNNQFTNKSSQSNS